MLTLKEAADYLGISLTTLRRVINNGEIVTVRIGIRGVRIEESELQRYIEQRRQLPPSDSDSGKAEALACAMA
jgi:excisionase family DNA binding protein